MEYTSDSCKVKLQDGPTFECGDRKDGYTGVCNVGNYCTNKNVCNPIPTNSKWPITQSLSIDTERNYAYRSCNDNFDKHCIVTNCQNVCDNNKIRIK